jgi:cystathionine beta-lyase/cystathionine gamma-synthase
MRLDPNDVALCAADDEPEGMHPPHPAAPPIVPTSLFSFPTYQSLIDGMAHEYETTVYSRGRNPTVQLLEGKLAALERGESCSCFASGMAAVSAVMLSLLRSGDHVLFVNHVYGPTKQLCTHLGRFGITHDTVLDLDADAVRAAMKPNTKLVWTESPGTMMMRMLSLPAISQVAHDAGALVCFDNSWATPLLQKPLELGADIVVHSATKYLGGHSDLIAGAVIASDALMREVYARGLRWVGGSLGPFEAWLMLRGLRTLPVRLKQHEEDALAVAQFLRKHPAVVRVNHPAISDPALVDGQLRGSSGLFSFELADGDFTNVSRVIDRLRRFRIGVSWGGVESIVIGMEGRGSRERLSAQGIPPGLIRLSVGLEGAELLMQDLAQALEPA